MRAPSGISLAAKPVRVAGAVPALVVRAHDAQPLAAEQRHVLEHLLADRRVLLQDAPLVRLQRPALEQDPVGDADVADVVEHEAPLEARVVATATARPRR